MCATSNFISSSAEDLEIIFPDRPTHRPADRTTMLDIYTYTDHVVPSLINITDYSSHSAVSSTDRTLRCSRPHGPVKPASQPDGEAAYTTKWYLAVTDGRTARCAALWIVNRREKCFRTNERLMKLSAWWSNSPRTEMSGGREFTKVRFSGFIFFGSDGDSVLINFKSLF